MGGGNMAHFYADIRGARGEATRLGHKNTGIRGHIRGWNIGAYVSIVHVNGEDIVSVSLTRGSNNSGNERRLGSFKLKNNRIVKQG